jgi:methylenetetrahydrofolate dehydrogenase (NADP+)/methenyltetrahydrofolate cyclohydrolase
MSKIVDGKKLAHCLLRDVTNKALYLKNSHNITAKIVTILVGHNSASEVYVRAKLEAAQKVGIIVDLVRFDHDITKEQLIKKLKKLNDDCTVTGVLVQFPLPKHLNVHDIFNTISSVKDIDGFGVYNTGLLNHNQSVIEPCTPQGILYVLKKYCGNLTGKKAVVIGRSIIVGRPVLSMLLNANCTVTQVHSKTVNIKKECLDADIIIVAVGIANFLQATWVKRGCFVVDVGINRYEGKLVGDADFSNLLTKVSYITPVPGGIGPLTVASLMLNAVKLCYIQNRLDWDTC